jgi:hypothetical protein
MQTPMKLQDQILQAVPDMPVTALVRPEVLARVPPKARRDLAQRRVKWISNRLWGKSFRRGPPYVLELGHRRGDHILQNPEYLNIPPKAALLFMRLHLEGVILHELGHCILDEALARDPTVSLAQIHQHVLRDGSPSTYLGHDRKMSVDDRTHEGFAEALRWYMVNPKRLHQDYPRWWAVISWALRASER